MLSSARRAVRKTGEMTIDDRALALRHVLSVAGGHAAGHEIDVDRDVIIGREGEVSALLDDPQLSRRHALLRRDAAGSITIEDLGSTNGTFVNGQLLQGCQVLSAGDVVKVGSTTIEVQLERVASESSSDDIAASGGPVSPTHQVGSPTAVHDVVRAAIPPPATLLHGDKRVVIPRGGLSLGRSPESDIVVASHLASRSHARVGVSEDRYYVADAGSINGTYLNGERLLGEARWLAPGDAIAVGGESIRFLTGQETHIGAEGREPGIEFVRFDGRSLTIGRDGTNDVQLEAPSISRFHAEIVATDGGVELRDLGSRNGTRLDGELVTNAGLRTGSEIGIGPFRLLFDGESFLQRDERGALRLDAYDVGVAVREKVILERMSLSMQPGEFVAVIGESGSGKSTLLRVLAGVSRPSQGAVLVNGERIEMRLAELGYLPQDEIVHPRLSVLESLRYSARLRLPVDASSADVEEAVTRVLGETGLEGHRGTRIGSLSGGQRKRVGLATELLNSPGLLFLDEPTTGLDPGLETRMMELFRRLAEVGDHALLVVTHATRNLELVDRLCVMGRGGVPCFVGAPEESKRFFGVKTFDDIYGVLEDRPAEEWRREFEDAAPEPPPPVDRAAVSQRTTPRGGREASRAQGVQAGVLTRRYLKVFVRDRRNLVLLLLQAPFLGLAAALLFKPDLFALDGQGLPSSAAQLLFILVVTMAWLGTISSAREIIKEAAVFVRERAVGVRVSAYLASKLAVLAPLVAIQAAFLAVVVFQLRPLYVSDARYAAVFVVLALTGLVAVAMGLCISAFVKSEEQAMALIPVAMILQLLFGGAIVTVQSMGGVVATLSGLIYVRWAFAGVGEIAEMNARIVGDEVFSASNPYGLSFFDVPFPATVAILGAFAAVFLLATGVLLRRRAA